jgi:uncharacterized delta-60 repeat protein
MDTGRRIVSTVAAVAAFALAAGASAAQAAPGALDTDFGSGGKLLFDAGAVGLRDLKVQPDGKVVTLDAGFDPQHYMRIHRFLPDGTPDPSFGTNGTAEPFVAPAFWATALALQPDGKVVVAGYDSADDFAVARLMPDGSLDPDFDGDSGAGNGIIHTPLTPALDMASSVAVDGHGRIVVAGKSAYDVAIARYLPDGKLDKSFAGDGSVVDITSNLNEEVHALVVQDDGIMVAGYAGPDAFIARYLEQGQKDTAFGDWGRRIVDGGADHDRVESIALQSDRTILLGVFAAGPTKNPPDSVVALTPGGDIDQSFGDAGSVSFEGGINSVAVAAGDKIVVGGYADLEGESAFAIARRNADGSPDPSFAGGGPVLTRFHAGDGAAVEHVAIAPDGKIIAGGTTSNSALAADEAALARYLVDPDPPASGGTAGGGSAGGTSGAGETNTGPLVLSGLKLTSRTFAVARRSTRLVGRAHAAAARRRGTAFVYTLNRDASVTIHVKRLRRGARVLKLRRSSGAGRNRVRFTGRVGRSALRPGRYRATLVATDASGGRSQPRSVRFRIVRP